MITQKYFFTAPTRVQKNATTSAAVRFHANIFKARNRATDRFSPTDASEYIDLDVQISH